ncbi:hypothetical protein P8C59_004287 [Phyllachora maydis]|uniref:Reverse transcriptase Ty1/copia-type domain-containing protein n=1 Tax=Phyllachora maydis TaxID=1825666 RepID=A0AAD9I2G8_9PEZI|nr:hypothetical protein P8C59_004287 [Phyllachora maydis]
MANILEESRNPAIEAKKGKNKKKGKKKASYNVKGQNYSAKSAEQASFILGSYNLAIEEEEESDSSSDSSSSSDSNTQLAQLLALKGPVSPAGIGSIILEVLSRKAPPTYIKLVLDNVLYLPNINRYIVRRVRHYDLGGCLIKEILYRGDRRCIAILDFKKSGFFLDVKGSSKPIFHANFAFPSGLTSYNTTKGIEPQRNKIVLEIPSKSIRKEDYRHIIEDALVSEAIEPEKRYKLRNSPAKGTTLEGTREPKPLPCTRDLPRILREPVIEGNKIEKAISSPTLKEPNIGYIGLRLLKKTSSIAKGLPNFDKIKEADFHCSSYDQGKAVRRVSKALIPNLPRVLDLIEVDTVKIRPRPYNRNPIVLLLVNRKKGELVDLDLDLEGAVSPDPSNLNTKKPISIEIGPSKLEPYKSSSDSELDKPLPDKPINPVIVESTRPTISFRKPELPEEFPQTIESIFTPKPREIINSDLILEGDKMQLDYYKLLAKTSSYILSFVYKARKRVISKASTPTTCKQVLKLPRDKRSKWLEAITKEFIQLLEPGVFKFLPRSLLPSNYKLITCRNVLKVTKDAENRPIKYKSCIPPTWRILLAIGAVLDWEIEQATFIGAFLNSTLRKEIYMEIPEGLLDLAASNKATFELLLKYSYTPSTPNIIKLSKALYSLKQSPREWQDKLKTLLKSLGYLPLISDLGVFYNAKTCHFIVTYIDNCPFIGPDIGYITDSKKRLNKVYTIEDFGPAAYFLGVQIIRDRPNRRL